MKYMFKDFEDSLFKQACYIKQTQLNMLEQCAKFPKWIAANNYGLNVPKECLDSINRLLDTAHKLYESGFFTFTLNDRKARNK